jgi:cytochrome b involved in lipid metabolism
MMNLNRASAILSVFTLAATMLMGAGCSSAPQPAQPVTSATPTAPVAPQRTVTTAEVAAHATSTDCWTIVDGKVYDMTSYFGRHPGGDETILPLCGKDGSEAYATKGKPSPQPHSPKANLQLQSLYVGDFAK